MNKPTAASCLLDTLLTHPKHMHHFSLPVNPAENLLSNRRKEVWDESPLGGRKWTAIAPARALLRAGRAKGRQARDLETWPAKTHPTRRARGWSNGCLGSLGRDAYVQQGPWGKQRINLPWRSGVEFLVMPFLRLWTLDQNCQWSLQMKWCTFRTQTGSLICSLSLFTNCGQLHTARGTHSQETL